jgi:hypothetical protein
VYLLDLLIVSPELRLSRLMPLISLWEKQNHLSFKQTPLPRQSFKAVLAPNRKEVLAFFGGHQGLKNDVFKLSLSKFEILDLF